MNFKTLFNLRESDPERFHMEVQAIDPSGELSRKISVMPPELYDRYPGQLEAQFVTAFGGKPALADLVGEAAVGACVDVLGVVPTSTTPGHVVRWLDPLGSCRSVAVQKTGMIWCAIPGGDLVGLATESMFAKSVIHAHRGFDINDISIRDSMLATAADDKTTKIIDLETHETVLELPHEHEVTAVTWCGEFIVTGTKQGAIAFWNGGNKFVEHEAGGMVFALAANASGSFVVSSTLQNVMSLWDGRSGDLLRCFVGELNQKTAVTTSDQLFYIAADNTSGIGHKKPTRAIRFIDEREFVSVEGDLIRWRIDDHGIVGARSIGYHPDHHEGDLVITDNGRVITGGSSSLKVWNLDHPDDGIMVPSKGGLVSTLALTTDGNLVVGCRTGDLRCLDPSQVTQPPAHVSTISDIVEVGDGVLTAGTDGQILRWNSNGEVIERAQLDERVSAVFEFERMVACTKNAIIEIGETSVEVYSSDYPMSAFASFGDSIYFSKKSLNRFDISDRQITALGVEGYLGEHTVDDDGIIVATQTRKWSHGEERTFLSKFASSNEPIVQYEIDDVAIYQMVCREGFLCALVDDGSLRVWNSKTGETIATYHVFEKYGFNARFVSPTELFVIDKATSEALVIDVTSGNVEKRTALPEELLVMDVSDRLLVGSVDKHYLVLVDHPSGEIVAGYRFEDVVYRCQFVRDGTAIIVTFKSGDVVSLLLNL